MPDRVLGRAGSSGHAGGGWLRGDGRVPVGSVVVTTSQDHAGRLHRALCSAWPHDPGVSGTVRSDVPIVFLNGTADPGDPPASVAGATATMPHALLVSVPGVGHWTLSWNPHPGCLLAATTAFIQVGRPASPAPWHACTRALASQPMPIPAA